MVLYLCKIIQHPNVSNEEYERLKVILAFSGGPLTLRSGLAFLYKIWGCPYITHDQNNPEIKSNDFTLFAL